MEVLHLAGLSHCRCSELSAEHFCSLQASRNQLGEVAEGSFPLNPSEILEIWLLHHP